MERRALAVAGLVVAVTAVVRPLQAQIAWDTPMLIGPDAPAGLGIFVMEPWPGDIAVMGTYRTSPVPVGLGFRVGVGEGAADDRDPDDDDGDDLAVFGGVDLSGFLLRATGDVPLDVLWFTGAGVGIGGDALFSFPLGLSVGINLESEGVSFRPYAAPRVMLDVCVGDDTRFCRVRDGLELDVAADLGLDLAFDPRWLIRFAATVGDDRDDALLIGIAFPR